MDGMMDEQNEAPVEHGAVKAQESAPDPALAPRLCAQFSEARRALAPCYAEAREDWDFYDGHQWTREQIEELKSQGRPPIVINQISKATDNVSGRERQGRFDWKVNPRGASDVQAAHAMTEALKYVADQTKARYVISEAFEHALKGPMGWLRVGYDDSKLVGDCIELEAVPYEEMLFDPYSRKWDFSDVRYVIRRRKMSPEDAKSQYAGGDPAKEALIDRAARPDALDAEHQQDLIGDYDNRDDGTTGKGFVSDAPLGEGDARRVEVREHWFFEHKTVTLMEMEDGELVEPEHDAHAYALATMGGQMVEKTRKVWKVAIMVGGAILSLEESIYPWEGSPFVPVWCKRDRLGMPHGLIRIMKWPQRELNVNRSRANESQRSRWAIVREGALNPGKLLKLTRDLARSFFVAEVPSPADIQVGSDKADLPGYMNLMETSRREIDDVVGNNEAAYGDKSNEQSGKAIDRRVMQQSLNLAKVFDNLGAAREVMGEYLLALMQRYYKPAKLARIIEAQAIKVGAAQSLDWLGEAFANPITQLRFDVEVSDVGESDTERQAEMQQRIELMAYVPDQLKPLFLPDLIRSSDWAGADEMAAKLEQALQPPPMTVQGVPPGPMPQPTLAPPGMVPGGVPSSGPPESLPLDQMGGAF
jgi:hypothetical protein